MKAHVPVDSLPQFKGLNLRSSHLVLAAKAHLAKGEPFEAAVRWVEAGRAFADLAQALVEEGYAYAATQDFLNAASCFLEAGDYRPAEAVLEALQNLPQLRAVVGKNRDFSVWHRELKELCNERRALFERAKEEMRKQMREPGHEERLKERWFTEVFSTMPGVPEFHALAAGKAVSRKMMDRSIIHYRLCRQLKPEYAPYRLLLVDRLLAGHRWDEAGDEAEQAMVNFASDPVMLFLGAWVKVRRVISGTSPKRVLLEAKELLERALTCKHVGARWSVLFACWLSVCMNRLGEKEQAERILRLTVREWPIPDSDLAWELLRLKPADREAHVFARIPELLPAA